MSQQSIYKAVLRGVTCQDEATPLIACMVNRATTADLIERAAAWLLSHGKERHFIQAYNNADHRTSEAIIVLSDRDTAMMMKLALIR